MNIRDVAGINGPSELYELASHYGVHVGSMDQLIRFDCDLQQRERLHRARSLDRMVENAEDLGLYLSQEVPSGEN